jgi:PPOX class probable FMN-dependent enzyme
MRRITTIPDLESIYRDAPATASTAKEVDRITPAYRRLIEASPFVALATCGPGGLDCSPRGDKGQVVRVLDEKTLALPDRRGNNRIDTLRNVITDPRVALLFLIPGSGTTFRVNGRATLTDDLQLCKSFEMEGKLPRSVMVIAVEAAYFQCARAVKRAGLWDAAQHVDEKSLPSIGEILQDLSKGEIDGEAYDKEWPIRAAKTMW